jgi:hypothetical protein
MQLGIFDLRLAPQFISEGADASIKIAFEAKNQDPAEDVTFIVSIGDTAAQIFMLNDNNEEVKAIVLNKKIGNSWKKHSIPLRFRLKKTPSDPTAVLIKLSGQNNSGSTDDKISSVTCL